MGLNWLLLFEAFNRTSVAIATVCYYMAPIGVMLLSPVVLKEKVKATQLVGVLMAFVGIAIVSGLFTGGGQNSNIADILYGLASAFFYMLLVIFNKLSTPMEAYTKTGWQLLCSAVVVIVAMAFATDTTPVSSIAPTTWGLMAFMGIVHTGLAFAILFSCMEKVSAQSVRSIATSTRLVRYCSHTSSCMNPLPWQPFWALSWSWVGRLLGSAQAGLSARHKR